MSLRLPERIKLPALFVEIMLQNFPEEIVQRFCNAVEAGGAYSSVRFNPLKKADGYTLELGAPVEWCNGDGNSGGGEVGSYSLACGAYLKERPRFADDPLFLCGTYYVQDASSMFMNLVYNTITGILHDSGEKTSPVHDFSLWNILDLCAAPGGKSTHLATLFPDSLIVANEVIRSRVTVLAENITKWGASNCVVTNSDPSGFRNLPGFFNLVLVDAPCSGEGMFRKEPQAVESWSLDNVKLCAERQRRILADIWPVVADGGFLIYSTCTFNPYENDSNVEFLKSLGGEVVESLPAAAFEQIVKTNAGGCQFIPGLVDGEGQYFAIIRKRGQGVEECRGKNPDSKGRNTYRKKEKNRKAADVRYNLLSRLLGEQYIFEEKGDLVKAYRKSLHERIKIVESTAKVIHSGVVLAKVKGRDIIPHSDFALSDMLASACSAGNISNFNEFFHAVEVDSQTALSYFSHNTFIMPDAPPGFLLLCHKGIPLGFVKNIGKRVNIL